MYEYVKNDIDRLIALGAVLDVPLSEHTSFKIGGNAALALDPTSERQIADALQLCEKRKIPVALFGRGTNLLVSDSGFSGLVILFRKPLFAPAWNGSCVTVSAGASLTQLAKESVAAGWMGMERLCGIPGTVGGACAMNAGAYGAEIKQILRRVRVYRKGKVEWLDVDPDQLGYRKSPFIFPDCVVLAAELELQPDDGGAAERMQDCMTRRRDKQPLEYPSAGSVFKRPEGYFAGALIEQCGLKGMTVGGAQVSQKHAGFIINIGGATERDVSELIVQIQETVRERTGVTLECEIKRIGDSVCIS